MRVFQVIVFLGMLAALWSAGNRLARWLVPDWQPLSRAVAAFSLAVGIAVVPATWMGQFGMLRPTPFLVWIAAAFLLSRFLPEKNVGAGLVPALDGEAEKRAGTSPAPTENYLRSARIERALLIAAALAIALTGLREIRGMRYRPPELYDDLSYHLSTVATWVRHGDLRMVRFSMGDPSTPFYPVLGEVTSWALIAPFRDSDVAARWTQLPFALFSFLAVAAIARNLGLARRDAAFAAVSYAGIHHVFPFIAIGAGNDHATSFFTLAAVDGALNLARRPRAGAAAVTGTALGLLLATKYIGVLFAPVILVLLILAFIAERRREDERVPARTLASLAILLAATMAVTGGYTYLRNAATTGNPLFPAPVQIFGLEIFPGWEGITPAWRDTSPEARIDVWQFLTRRTRLFGSYFPFTLLPAAVLAPLLALWKRRWREALVFSLPAAFFLQFLFLMHDHRDNRYFLPGIALAAVALAWLLAQAGRRAVPIRAVLLAWIAWQVIRDFKWTMTNRVLTALALLLAAALLEMAWQRWRTRETGTLRSRIGPWWRVAAAGLLLAAAVPLGAMVAIYQKVKLVHEPAALALERLAGPAGARVAYAGLNKPYLFYGSRLQNEVEIVPRSRALDARTYRWGSRLADPYNDVGSYRRWRGNVERLGIEYVVVIRSPWEDPERRWLAHRTQGFQRVYADARTEIWRVLPRHAAARRPGAADRPAPGRRAPAKGWKPGGRNGSPSSSRSSPDRGRSSR